MTTEQAIHRVDNQPPEFAPLPAAASFVLSLTAVNVPFAVGNTYAPPCGVMHSSALWMSEL